MGYTFKGKNLPFRGQLYYLIVTPFSFKTMNKPQTYKTLFPFQIKILQDSKVVFTKRVDPNQSARSRCLIAADALRIFSRNATHVYFGRKESYILLHKFGGKIHQTSLFCELLEYGDMDTR